MKEDEFIKALFIAAMGCYAFAIFAFIMAALSR